MGRCLLPHASSVGICVRPLRIGERPLQFAPHESHARAARLVAERCGCERVRLEHDPLPLVLEAAADDEEKCPVVPTLDTALVAYYRTAHSRMRRP